MTTKDWRKKDVDEAAITTFNVAHDTVASVIKKMVMRGGQRMEKYTEIMKCGHKNNLALPGNITGVCPKTGCELSGS